MALCMFGVVVGLLFMHSLNCWRVCYFVYDYAIVGSNFVCVDFMEGLVYLVYNCYYR